MNRNNVAIKGAAVKIKVLGKEIPRKKMFRRKYMIVEFLTEDGEIVEILVGRKMKKSQVEKKLANLLKQDIELIK